MTNDEMATQEDGDTKDDAAIIDLNEANIKKLITKAKRRGYVTVDELNEALPQDELSSEQIEDVMSAISEMGVNIVETDEDAEAESDSEDEADEIGSDEDDDDDGASNKPAKPAAAAKKKEVVERTDDPVRMYLREMGAVELLSREGEIAIAKRIEAGRDMMIMGLCESPITFHAIILWSEALNSEEMQLREILDLDAMLSKEPPVEKMEEGAEDDDEEPEISEATAGPTYKEEEEVEEAEEEVDEDDEDGEPRARRREEEEEEDNTLSLAQMEAQLKPAALETFARITALFKKFEKLQAERVEILGSGQDYSDHALFFVRLRIARAVDLVHQPPQRFRSAHADRQRVGCFCSSPAHASHSVQQAVCAPSISCTSHHNGSARLMPTASASVAFAQARPMRATPSSKPRARRAPRRASVLDRATRSRAGSVASRSTPTSIVPRSALARSRRARRSVARPNARRRASVDGSPRGDRDPTTDRAAPASRRRARRRSADRGPTPRPWRRDVRRDRRERSGRERLRRASFARIQASLPCRPW